MQKCRCRASQSTVWVGVGLVMRWGSFVERWGQGTFGVGRYDCPSKRHRHVLRIGRVYPQSISRKCFRLGNRLVWFFFSGIFLFRKRNYSQHGWPIIRARRNSSRILFATTREVWTRIGNRTDARAIPSPRNVLSYWMKRCALASDGSYIEWLSLAILLPSNHRSAQESTLKFRPHNRLLFRVDLAENISDYIPPPPNSSLPRHFSRIENFFWYLH